MDHPRPPFHFIFSLFKHLKQTIHFYNKLMWKNVQLVSGVEIRTLEHEFATITTRSVPHCLFLRPIFIPRDRSIFYSHFLLPKRHYFVEIAIFLAKIEVLRNTSKNDIAKILFLNKSGGLCGLRDLVPSKLMSFWELWTSLSIILILLSM